MSSALGGTFPDLKGQAPLRQQPARDGTANGVPFPDLKGQAPLRPAAFATLPSTLGLFLTSKVRLHCDKLLIPSVLKKLATFPDLKGQAPLRPVWGSESAWREALFLTSKVRLHCDEVRRNGTAVDPVELFLTSKVRLHCDSLCDLFHFLDGAFS